MQEHKQQMPLVQPKISMKKEQDNLIKNKTKQKNLNRIKFRIIELHLKNKNEYNRNIEYNRAAENKTEFKFKSEEITQNSMRKK